MHAGFLIFTLLFGLKEGVLLRSCPSLSFPRHGRVNCLLENARRPCGTSPPAGSVAEFTCEQFYRLSSESRRYLQCRLNGRWSSVPPKCVPDCGRRSEFGGLVVNGVMASLGEFPWHVGIYNLINESYDYWCGGSLISETVVVTAAHCTWEISPNKLMLAFGKFHRDFNLLEKTAQKIKALKIEIPSSYQDVAGNYNGDVALIFLEREVRLNRYATPICIDWGQRLMKKHLSAGTSGLAVGWGLTENETLSDFLRTVVVPVVSDEKCIAEQERDFRKFVSFTSFCAGFRNGSGVCNGDSGGGLAFFDEGTGRWYLHGLVSVSPRRNGTPYCDLNFYTIFTKVTVFTKWLKEVMEARRRIFPFARPFELSHATGRAMENYYEFFRIHFDQSLGRKINFPHTMKMLELAGLVKRSRSAF